MKSNFRDKCIAYLYKKKKYCARIVPNHLAKTKNNAARKEERLIIEE